MVTSHGRSKKRGKEQNRVMSSGSARPEQMAGLCSWLCSLCHSCQYKQNQWNHCVKENLNLLAITAITFTEVKHVMSAQTVNLFWRQVLGCESSVYSNSLFYHTVSAKAWLVGLSLVCCTNALEHIFSGNIFTLLRNCLLWANHFSISKWHWFSCSLSDQTAEYQN